MTTHFGLALIAVFAHLAAASGGAPASGGAVASLNPAVPGDASPWMGESGVASYYGAAYHGRRAASGARFDQMALTAAHPWLPFGTKVKVILKGTNRSVIVTITDRLGSSRRIVDLSFAAARRLGMINRGLAEVSLLPV
jgi:rare lipoprotein A